MYEHHSSDFHFLIDGPYSYPKYLVCNKEATNNNANVRECVSVVRNPSTQSAWLVPGFLSQGLITGMFLSQKLIS